MYKLFFNISGESPESRVVEFKNAEDKQTYVLQEAKACAAEAKRLAVATDRDERKDAKKALDLARWEFCKELRKQSILNRIA